ncbi:dihydrodipicolinate synthase family protein [Portibacter lacus]|uniref:N-acetylneuraminate lyase n=1 Tax=Portibacter lacus TaxID=1099794 RepID=A0AA37SK84_9BACT|nr:dihydrodipicolinate synthase family protein [Portibacter lacus]GLR15565.1 N-acetylneuraminate lyase [Portibacter lacus]
METNLTGIIAAPYTPFDENGEINLKIISKYADYLKKNGVSGAFVCGTTGEGLLMSIEERKAVAAEWMKHRDDQFKIIVHVGATSYKDASSLTRHACEIDADAFSAMGPLFLKPDHVDDLISYCQEIAQAGASKPFFYYHIPSVSGVNLPMVEFLNKAESKIPNLAGIKFTHNNMMEMQLCMNLNDKKWNILHGQDETLLAGLTLGAKGGVGSTYNYMAPLYIKIIEAYNNGDIESAANYQLLAAKFISYLIKYGGGVIGGKPLMKLVGVDCGQLRTPCRNNTSEDIKEFEKAIMALDLLQYFHQS